MMKVLQLLKDSGHPFYQFCDDFNIDAYKKRCQDEDKQGYELLFDSEENNSNKTIQDLNKSNPNNTKGSCKDENENVADIHLEDIADQDAELSETRNSERQTNIGELEKENDINLNMENKVKGTEDVNPEDDYEDEYVIVRGYEEGGLYILDLLKEHGNNIRVTISPDGEEEIYATDVTNEEEILDVVDLLMEQFVHDAEATGYDKSSL